jgi:hypothetical protein
MKNQYAEILRNTAAEIRAQDILGWGNACDFAADEIDRLQAEVERLSTPTSYDAVVTAKSIAEDFIRNQGARNAELEAALRGLYEDQVDYLRLNHLGGMDNHWMKAARQALVLLTDADSPASGGGEHG